MMAFAASSDLLTMTIANRVSLILIAGFVAAGAAERAWAAPICCRISAPAAAVLGGRIRLLCLRLDRRRRRQARRGDGACGSDLAILFSYLVYASLLGGALTLLIVQFRTCRCRACSRGGNGRSGCTPGRRRALWRGARRGCAAGLSADRMDDGGRRPVSSACFSRCMVSSRRRARARVNATLTRFGYASLTML